MYRLLSRFCISSMPFYAVRRGRDPGVYTTWVECEKQVKGFTNARFKKFTTEKEALEFVNSTGDTSCTTVTGSNADDYKTSPDKQSMSVIKQGGYQTDACRSNNSNSNTKSNTRSKNRTDVSKTGKNSSVVPSAGKRSAILLSFDEIPAKKLKSDSVEVYTDGCCLDNGKGSPQAGIGVYWGPGHPNNLSERLPGRQTNNRAEIFAAVRAVQQAKSAGIKEITIFTDSQFLINCQTKWMSKWKSNGWKSASGQSVVNREELEMLDTEQAGLKVTYEHVKGHSGIEGNEVADRLANMGAAKPLDTSA